MSNKQYLSPETENQLCYDAAEISFGTFEIEYPGALNARNAAIFGNQANDIPVRVRVQASSSDGQDITEDVLNNIELYDVRTKKRVAGYKGPATHIVTPPPSDASQDLVSAQSPGRFSLGLYPQSGDYTSSEPLVGDAMERYFYVQSAVLTTMDKNFTIGAYLATTSTPNPDDPSMTSEKQTGGKGTLNLKVIPPMNYTDSTAWVVSEASSSVQSNDVLHCSELDSSRVEIKSKQWQLHNTRIKDFPLRMNIGYWPANPSYASLITVPNAMAYSVLNNHDSYNKNQAQSTVWTVPGYQDCKVYGDIKGNGNKRVEFTRQLTVLPGNNAHNTNVTTVTIEQVTVTIRDEGFTVQTPASVLNGRLRITDNAGHDQTIDVTFGNVDGKPAISGRG